MISAGVCNSFKQEILQGIHQPGDTYFFALYSSGASISSSTTAYTTSGEVSGSGYTAGGVALLNPVYTLDTGVAILSFDNPSWSNATITARGGLIYNSSKSNKAVVVVDFGSDIISTAGLFQVFFPAATAAAGLIRAG